MTIMVCPATYACLLIHPGNDKEIRKVLVFAFQRDASSSFVTDYNSLWYCSQGTARVPVRNRRWNASLGEVASADFVPGRAMLIFIRLFGNGLNETLSLDVPTNTTVAELRSQITKIRPHVICKRCERVLLVLAS